MLAGLLEGRCGRFGVGRRQVWGLYTWGRQGFRTYTYSYDEDVCFQGRSALLG